MYLQKYKLDVYCQPHLIFMASTSLFYLKLCINNKHAQHPKY